MTTDDELWEEVETGLRQTHPHHTANYTSASDGPGRTSDLAARLGRS